MPTFEVDYDGKTFEVDAPDEATAWKWAKQSASEPKPFEGYLPGLASHAAQGFTFGFGDEIADKLGAGDRYRATLSAFEKENPKAAIAANVGGSLVAPLGAFKLAAKAPYAAAATVGGLGGALQGAGDAPHGAENTVQGAAVGLGTGAALGPAFLGMAKPVGSVMSALGTKIPGIGDDIAEGLARRQVVRSLQRDNISPADLTSRMVELGPEARIADAAGENTRGVLNLNAYLPGKTANNLEELIRNRIATRPDRMDTVVNEVSGNMGRAKSLINSLTEQQKKTATPLYQKAHSQVIAADDDLIGILDAAKKLGAFGEAKTIATAERSPFTLENLTTGNVQSTTNTLTNQVTNKVTGASQMSVKDLDYVKRGLDSLIEANTNEFGKLNSKGVAFLNLKKDLLSKVDNLSPEFAAARQAFAGPEALKSATNKGRSFWNEKADRLEDIVSGMTDSERQAFQVGAAEQLREMAGSQTGQNRLLNIWKDRPTQEKLKALLGNDVKYSEVEKFLKGEMTLKRLEGLGPSRNSRTAQVEAMNENQTMETMADAAGMGVDLARGNFMAPVTKATKMFGRLGTPESVRDGIGKILMKQYAPPEIKALMEAEELIRRQQALAAGAAGTAGGKTGSGLLD